jgi:hypothetical protein
LWQIFPLRTREFRHLHPSVYRSFRQPRVPCGPRLFLPDRMAPLPLKLPLPFPPPHRQPSTIEVA